MLRSNPSICCRLARSSRYPVSFTNHRGRLKLFAISLLMLNVMLNVLNWWRWSQSLVGDKLLLIIHWAPIVLLMAAGTHVVISGRKYIMLMEVAQHDILDQMTMTLRYKARRIHLELSGIHSMIDQ
jgi:hypothetical protein